MLLQKTSTSSHSILFIFFFFRVFFCLSVFRSFGLQTRRERESFAPPCNSPILCSVQNSHPHSHFSMYSFLFYPVFFSHYFHCWLFYSFSFTPVLFYFFHLILILGLSFSKPCLVYPMPFAMASKCIYPCPSFSCSRSCSCFSFIGLLISFRNSKISRGK